MAGHRNCEYKYSNPVERCPGTELLRHIASRRMSRHWDCFANARNDGLHGRLASFPAFTHSQAYSPGQHATVCWQSITHSSLLIRRPALSPLDRFANARNDGLAGRLASLPAFTHSQAYSPGQPATVCWQSIAHRSFVPTALSPLDRFANARNDDLHGRLDSFSPFTHSLTSQLARMTRSPHSKPLLIAHCSLLIRIPAHSPGRSAITSR
jgi:hypothetical protein